MRSVLAGEVHTQRASVEIRSVERVHRILCSGLVRELAEAEAFRASGLAIADDSDVGDLASLTEEASDGIFGGLVRQIADVDGEALSLHGHFGQRSRRRRRCWNSTGFLSAVDALRL